MKYKLEGNIFDNHPELKEYEEFNWKAPLSANRLTYIALVYSSDSPIADMDDIVLRKKSAFKTSGLPKNLEERIISNEDDITNAMITRFFKIQNEAEIELLMSGKEAFHILLEEVRSPVSDELNDDRKASALKAKRICFEDAYNIMEAVKKIQTIIKESNTDISRVFEKTKDKDQWSKGWVENLVDKK